MPKFLVEVEWSGYSRGTSKWIVEADSAEEAETYYYEGDEIENKTVRDDTEATDSSATEIKD